MKTCIPGETAQLFTTVESFIERLLEPLGAKTVAVVYAAEEKDLIDLYFIQHLLAKVLLVLLLPDAEPHTIAMGHRLHPFYMCTADIHMSDLMAVLNDVVNHGYAPKPGALFRNVFESVTHDNGSGVRGDARIYTAA